jgi:hypothetical protein
MDPLTLFALANGAVAAVKKGCELYKEMSGAIGDVKGVLQDLEQQFNSRHKDKPPTVAEKNQYINEKNRVIELSKRQPDDVYMEVANYLGEFFENMAKCQAVLEEEERHSTDVYTGSDSIGKRALQRVLMQTKLDAMQAELREIMVYQMPPEMGDLYTRVEKMMVRIKKEQSIAITNKMKKDRIDASIRKKRIERIRCEAWKYGLSILAILYLSWIMWAVVEIRKEVHPELGVCLIPKGSFMYKEYNSLKWVNCEPR